MLNYVVSKTTSGQKRKRDRNTMQNEDEMSFKIVVDSCCELPEELKNDDRFERVPLTLCVDEEEICDDESFDQAYFLRRVAESEDCPKSACPSPAKFMDAFRANVDRIYCITLSSKLSGSYNSAMTARNMLLEEEEEEGRKGKQIYICDSQSASIGETNIALLIKSLEEAGAYTFQQIVSFAESFRDRMTTCFVLDNLDALRKNGRLSGLKDLIVTTLNIKPIMSADRGAIIQIGQAVGSHKALRKMAETILASGKKPEETDVFISHCNNPKRAEFVKTILTEKAQFRSVHIYETAGVSSLYASDGGVITAF